MKGAHLPLLRIRRRWCELSRGVVARCDSPSSRARNRFTTRLHLRRRAPKNSLTIARRVKVNAAAASVKRTARCRRCQKGQRIKGAIGIRSTCHLCVVFPGIMLCIRPCVKLHPPPTHPSSLLSVCAAQPPHHLVQNPGVAANEGRASRAVACGCWCWHLLLRPGPTWSMWARPVANAAFHASAWGETLGETVLLS